jgi:hypothetical protein
LNTAAESSFSAHNQDHENHITSSKLDAASHISSYNKRKQAQLPKSLFKGGLNPSISRVPNDFDKSQTLHIEIVAHHTQLRSVTGN